MPPKGPNNVFCIKNHLTVTSTAFRETYNGKFNIAKCNSEIRLARPSDKEGDKSIWAIRFFQTMFVVIAINFYWAKRNTKSATILR